MTSLCPDSSDHAADYVLTQDDWTPPLDTDDADDEDDHSSTTDINDTDTSKPEHANNVDTYTPPLRFESQDVDYEALEEMTIDDKFERMAQLTCANHEHFRKSIGEFLHDTYDQDEYQEYWNIFHDTLEKYFRKYPKGVANSRRFRPY